jgi:ABC-2 type transport system ATP-binding protein
MPIITAENICFDYPGAQILKDISFALSSNSVTALVGPNGSGKTTLLRCLAGLLSPRHGKLTCDGVDISLNRRDFYRRLGYLHDSFGLYDALTVLQCLRHAAAMRGAGRNEEKQWVERAIANYGLEPRLNQLAGQLSRGWRQRLGMAQATIHNPDVLMLDEPASGLDPEARIFLSQRMRQLQSEGITAIISSHILTEVSAYSSHMLTLVNGTLAGIEPLDQPKTEYRKVRISFSKDVTVGEIPAKLSSSELLSHASKEWVVKISGGDQELSQFLATLIEEKLPVCGFVCEEETIEQRYLRLTDGAKS